MLRPAIIISELDAERIDRLLAKAEYTNLPIAQALNAELDRAEMCAPEQMPCDVVTMNSRVLFCDLMTHEHYTRTLVYPEALTDSRTQLSIMAPVGAALLGLRAGENIHWHLPDGSQTHLQVIKLEYQPESAGEYHR